MYVEMYMSSLAQRLLWVGVMLCYTKLIKRTATHRCPGAKHCFPEMEAPRLPCFFELQIYKRDLLCETPAR